MWRDFKTGLNLKESESKPIKDEKRSSANQLFTYRGNITLVLLGGVRVCVDRLKFVF